MNKSKNYDIVKDFYDRGKWSIKRVRNAVIKRWITKDEYKEITGEDYSE
jgi:uncharacterized XkdX family phage protein